MENHTHFLKLLDYTPAEIQQFLDTAADLKAKKKAGIPHRYLEGKTAVECDFMGGRASFPSGPFRIAAKCRVPVVFYYAMREKGRRYRFLFSEVPPTESRRTETLMTAYLRSLETLLARYPRQWFNFYPFWNE